MSLDAIMHAGDRWLRRSAAARAQAGPEVIDICGRAVAELVSRLQNLGYPVDPMLVPCNDVEAAIAELEEEGPAVPPALAEVWRQIGEISLVDLDRFRHMSFWDDRVGDDARVFACDGVVVYGPCGDEAWTGYVIDQFDEQAEIGVAPAFPISPDGLHKDNTSGGDPYELVPNPADPWMASLRSFSWDGPARPMSAPEGSTPDLVSYLRTAILECGGFPGLVGSAGFEPLRVELVEGLPVF